MLDCIIESCDEDMQSFQDSQRGTPLVKRSCPPEMTDTTSELYVRKCHTGSAR